MRMKVFIVYRCATYVDVCSAKWLRINPCQKSSKETLKRTHTLREKCPYSELLWSDCGKMQIRTTPNTDTVHVVLILKENLIFNSN